MEITNVNWEGIIPQQKKKTLMSEPKKNPNFVNKYSTNWSFPRDDHQRWSQFAGTTNTLDSRLLE